MTQFFIRLYQFFRSHQLICWLSMVALFIVFGWFATRIHLEEDIDKDNEQCHHGQPANQLVATEKLI